MAPIAEDIKSGLRGIKGAGDALRGSVMEATDQAFDSNPTHPTTVAKQQQHRQTAENGKQGIREADEMIARHESKRKTTAATEPQAAVVANQQDSAPGLAAPGIAAPNPAPENPANAAPYSQQPVETEQQGSRLQGTGRVGQSNAHYTTPGLCPKSKVHVPY
jgi:hypothetical protein